MEIVKIQELKSILKNINAKKIFSNENIEIIEIDLMPGEIIPEHKNDNIALFNIIAGKGKVTVDEDEYYVEKGDFMQIEKNLNREWINYGDIPLRIVVTKLMK